jgi:hypothetical protein
MKEMVPRQVRRSRFTRRATLVERGHPDRTCVVLDISSEGAKIVLADSSALPNRFELAFVASGPPRSCKLIWRRGKVVGLKFV